MDPLTAMGLASAAIKIGEELFSFISGERDRLQQSNEWTPEQETAFSDLQARRNNSPWQKPTDPPAAA